MCTVWLGIIGFLDDYFKLRARKKAQESGEKFVKKDSDGLAGISKIIGQVGLGIIIGVSLYFSNAVTVEREIVSSTISGSPPPLKRTGMQPADIASTGAMPKCSQFIGFVSPYPPACQ